MTPRTSAARPQQETGESFLIGVILSAWWLHSAHGEDTYAEDLLLDAVGGHGIAAVQRLARREQYHFKRGFWATLKRKARRR